MPIVSLELQKQIGRSGAPAARQELRRKARARVSREMRIRAADFNDGNFEEVCSTVNFSRDGLYFLTPHDRYCVGMRLRIAPATTLGTEGTWENLGKVVRVHRQEASFGVAVFLENHGASGAQATSASANNCERRSAARSHFVASTEIIDVNTGDHCRVRTADLSSRGCYIDTLNPLPLAATVRLQVEKENETVEFRAKVVSSHLGSGMGLVFEGMTGDQRSMLAKWLREKSEPFVAGSRVFPQHQEDAETTGQFAEDPRFLRLVNVLHRKGVLTESDIRSLLRDL
jgi:PilZ domain